jgi:hypothetical protein
MSGISTLIMTERIWMRCPKLAEHQKLLSKVTSIIFTIVYEVKFLNSVLLNGLVAKQGLKLSAARPNSPDEDRAEHEFGQARNRKGRRGRSRRGRAVFMVVEKAARLVRLRLA